MNSYTIEQVILGVLLGAGLGVAFFRSLRESARLYCSSPVTQAGASVALPIALHFGRFALTTVAFLGVAAWLPQGILPALLAFTSVGLVASRRAVGASAP